MPVNTAMNNEYTRAREDFDPLYYIIGLVLFLLFFCLFNKDRKADKKTPEERSEGDPKKTFFTVEDLR